MIQLTINIENKSVRPQLMKVLNTFEGVSIVEIKGNETCGLDVALNDLKEGRITRYDSVNDMFKNLGIE